ncbi:MAG TPA: hypothetical protein VGI99_04005 [Gemmataceae bacterium]|jgi:hypothetical protein
MDGIADEWSDRAAALAEWTMTHLVNRTDVWGRYVRRKGDETTQVVTAPFREERGKVFLDLDSLRKHFRTRQPSGQLGVHSASSDLTSRWLGIDVDLHDPDEWSVTPTGNLAAVRGWQQALVDRGLDPVLMDSNGMGGFHLLVVFAEPMSSASVHKFGAELVADYERRGLDHAPEVFPDKPSWDHYGDWLRLPGRHHTRPHYTRVWNDEPFAESRWLDGDDAINRLLATRPAPAALLESLGITRPRRTICLDFDGVMHSYRSGWCGAEVIPDPPIHGTKEAVARLRQQYRIAVLSSRCHTEEGRKAVENWLFRHGIVVDEVCVHKPPAHVYVDDRAVRFRGNWDDLMDEINQFRK